jgi:hypothetical protein
MPVFAALAGGNVAFYRQVKAPAGGKVAQAGGKVAAMCIIQIAIFALIADSQVIHVLHYGAHVVIVTANNVERSTQFDSRYIWKNT